MKTIVIIGGFHTKTIKKVADKIGLIKILH